MGTWPGSPILPQTWKYYSQVKKTVYVLTFSFNYHFDQRPLEKLAIFNG